MGQPDQFAKRTFADETERLTGGAVTWQDPPEIGLVKVQGDGLLLVRHPDRIAGLSAPWPEARMHEEILVELKMPGDHLDFPAVERALLRRQARQVQRAEESARGWLGQEPLWLVAPHVPDWLRTQRALVAIGPGCYRVEPSFFPFLWIAANDLPLRNELVPFLVARSGRALDEFARWVASRMPLAWVLGMVRSTAMSATVREELLWWVGKGEDPEVKAREREILQALLGANPDVQQKLVEKGRIAEARTALRRVLAQRKLALRPEEDARIEGCAELDVLERWHERAVTATTAAEALE
ncbi:hypothetical protein [Sorangium sp. So ce394]|uniref:hypothetical protein n=1 Tax=Sorangium sp. So ce394 TaxID=3133310 RepID=UPI003F5B31A0